MVKFGPTEAKFLNQQLHTGSAPEMIVGPVSGTADSCPKM